MKMRIVLNKNNRNRILILEVFVFIIISIVYVFILKEAYGYMGFNGVSKISNILIGYLFFILMLSLGRKIKSDFYYGVWHVIFIIFYFGQVIFYQFSEGSIKPLLANSIFLIVIFLFSFVKMNFKVFSLKGNTLNLILLVSLILFLPIFLKYYKYIDLSNLLLQNIYETRLFFRGFDDSFFGYLRAPLSRVILPSVLVLGIYLKKPSLILISSFMITFIFLVGALKSVFIGMFAVVLFYYGKKFIDKVYILLYLFLFLCILGIIFYVINGNTFFVNSFVRRILFIPPMLDNIYYDTFNEQPLYWSHNPFGSLFFDYPLSKLPNMYVGESILDKDGMSANVGIVTEGFFSFGYIGVFVHSILVCLIFSILKRIDIKPMFFGIVFVYIYYINTSFFTVLLVTHGLLFFILYSYFFLNKNYD